jgi:predicted NAD-dependent protein-ADP-ribosyltransferase YbiA (DUF1768 family)
MSMTPTVMFKAVQVMDFESLEAMTASRTPKECGVTGRYRETCVLRTPTVIETLVIRR